MYSRGENNHKSETNYKESRPTKKKLWNLKKLRCKELKAQFLYWLIYLPKQTLIYFIGLSS